MLSSRSIPIVILTQFLYLGWPTSGKTKPTKPSDDKDYYDEDYPPYNYDDDTDDNISIDQPEETPVNNVPDFINPQPQPPPQSGRFLFH